ncbi:DNA polymerase III subunit chi [uncultured Brevundimonas sp.]|uniref:DNA polymerase III subunit chi n=1 Tax=uncultured Brevundimonas sp. TaxID=213418 RepID=UPI0025DEBB80|nr:DNA polymerase III subunit chi [uncultured Brevundimonas sp.]
MTAEGGPEIWFYHLERSSLDQVLPVLLDKTLQRGWRATVRAASFEALEPVNERLWTFRDDSFLPHGRADEPHAERQPVLLSVAAENLNRSQALFVIDDTDLDGLEGIERCFIIFDGRDDQALAAARERWRRLKGQGADLSYWRQSEDGRWEKAA